MENTTASAGKIYRLFLNLLKNKQHNVKFKHNQRPWFLLQGIVYQWINFESEWLINRSQRFDGAEAFWLSPLNWPICQCLRLTRGPYSGIDKPQLTWLLGMIPAFKTRAEKMQRCK
jgi:hypothetical protein